MNQIWHGVVAVCSRSPSSTSLKISIISMGNGNEITVRLISIRNRAFVKWRWRENRREYSNERLFAGCAIVPLCCGCGYACCCCLCLFILLLENDLTSVVRTNTASQSSTTNCTAQTQTHTFDQIQNCHLCAVCPIKCTVALSAMLYF